MEDKIIIDLDLNIFDNENGIVSNSIVTQPAVGYEQYFFSDVEMLFNDDTTYEIESVMMVPDMLIPRKSIFGTYYHRFKKEVVDKALELFMKSGKANRLTFEHIPDTFIDNPDIVYLKYIYQIDGAVTNERYSNLPEGTIIARYKFLDKELYNVLKDNGFKGFSIEFLGMFDTDLDKLYDKNIELINKIIDSDATEDEKLLQLAKLFSIKQ
jgi:hypothetical protein